MATQREHSTGLGMGRKMFAGFAAFVGSSGCDGTEGFATSRPSPASGSEAQGPKGQSQTRAPRQKIGAKDGADGGVIFADRQREQGRAAGEPRLPFDRDAFARFSTR